MFWYSKSNGDDEENRFSINKQKQQQQQQEEEEVPLFLSETELLQQSCRSYGSASNNSIAAMETPYRAVRFQVVVWYVGPIDVVLGLVTMKFRVTIFWNAPTDQAELKSMAQTGYGTYDASNKKVWTMQGRQRAFQKELADILPGSNLVYVPPISILNAVDFDVIGEPEVCLIEEKDMAMKWTCMYKASLIQEHMRVQNFPHDEHDLVLKLGILKHRQPGRRWDRNKWRFGLATEEDSQGTIRVPHGLVVDHVQIPEFHRFSKDEKEKDLSFEIVPLFNEEALALPEGSACGTPCSPSRRKPSSRVDHCLQVKFHVQRDSGYYDNNIIPLLALLNIVGISTLALDPKEFGSRGEIILAIAFVSIGIRMTVDNKLPYVGYQIKMQRILNSFFYTLLGLHLESSVVYTMSARHGFPEHTTSSINYTTMFLATIYTALQLYNYYPTISLFGTMIKTRGN